jgi:hypothetical protein
MTSTSKCTDITVDTFLAQSVTGDMVTFSNECANKLTGWTHIRVFGARGCPSTPKSIMTQDTIVNPMPYGTDATKGKYFCISPGFKVASYQFLKP